MEKISEVISNMESMAIMLIPHTYPIGDRESEKDVLILKQREMTIDGYDMTLCLSASDYEDYRMWSLQVQAKHSPFLPFNLVCKIGAMFFGRKGVSYLEFAKDGKKIYCWTIRKRGRKILPPIKGSERLSYEGFEYNLMSDDSVDLH